MSENPTLGFLVNIENMLKELMLLGFGIVEKDFVKDVHDNAKIACNLGFETIALLLKNLEICASNYIRSPKKEQENELVRAIAKLQFAFSLISIGGVEESDAKEEGASSNTSDDEED